MYQPLMTDRMHSLRFRLLVILLACIVLPSLFVGWQTYSYLADSIRSERISVVGRTAETRHEQLNRIFRRTSDRNTAFLQDLPRRCGVHAAAAGQCIRNAVDAFLASEGAVGGCLFQDGKLQLRIGYFPFPDNALDAFAKGQLTLFSRRQAGPERAYLMRAADPGNGLVLGVAYPADRLIQPVFVTLPELGSSGETFLADGEGYFITKARYEAPQGHSHPISARPMERCLSGESAEVLDQDYRDVPVIHGFRFIPEMGGGCIMAHIDQAEAFQPLKKFRMQAMLATTLFGILAVLIASWLARRLIGPIVQLTGTAQQIAGGNLSVRADPKGRDELAQLAVAFNTMTDRLAAANAELECQVQERTQTLRASEEKYRTLFTNMTEAFQLGELLYDDQGKAVDIRNLEVNDSFYKHTDLPGNILNRPATEFLPKLEAYWLETLAAVVATGEPKRYCNYNADTERHYECRIFRPSPGRFAMLFMDVTESKRVEKALEESRNELQLLIATLPGFVWTATHDGFIDFISKAWYDYTGTTEETQLGTGWLECLHPDDREQRIKGWMQETLAARLPAQLECRIRRHDGIYRWFSIRATPVLDEAGRVIRWLGVDTDISELKQTQEELQASELRYKALFNNKTSAIAHRRIVFDERGAPIDYYVDAVNDTYVQMMGIQKANLLGKLVTEVFPGIDDYSSNAFEEIGRIGRDQTEGTFEFYFPPANKWISAHCFSPAYGEVISIYTDITAQKQVEATIRELNADLERRVEERTAELIAANHELESISYATSHDLRGPLGRINSFSALFEQRYRDRLDGEGLQFLDFIRQNATRLTQLVDDLLAHAKAARQPLELEEIEVSDLVQAILLEKQDELAEATAEVRVDVSPARVLGDAHALGQVLRNLLDNARKFSAKDRAPLIELSGRREADRYVLQVRDNGIGFDMAYHDRIFEMFRRLHTYSEYEGSGVGLALVKRAMERMHGRVWATSEPGQGTTFFLELRASGQRRLSDR